VDGRVAPAMTYDARYLRGIDHFNAHRWFEAHEEWEDLWIEVNDDRKGFYHGLIQAAVALHHASRGNVGGSRTLYARMRNNLDRFRPAYEGLDVNAFLARMSASLDPVFGGGALDAKAVPTIGLAPT
jgi:predicted metal-dependent hydrolase